MYDFDGDGDVVDNPDELTDFMKHVIFRSKNE